MSLKNKLNTWVKNALITEDQQAKIIAFEKQKSNGFLSKTALIIAGLFIGLGFCLIVAANWDILPTILKFVLDFVVFGCLVYGAFESIRKEKTHFKDLFLFLSFLMIAATIGLTAQTFNLSGGWTSFALSWCLLSLPYVLLSESFSFNVIWVLLLSSALLDDVLEKFFEYMFGHFEGVVWITLICAALSYAFEMFYDICKKKLLLFRAASKIALFWSYIALISIAMRFGITHTYYNEFKATAVCFVLIFIIVRLFWAFKEQNMLSFKRNTFLLEAYIFIFFASLFDDLLISGFGFILCGLAILLMVYCYKRTAKYIQKMEIFK